MSLTSPLWFSLNFFFLGGGGGIRCLISFNIHGVSTSTWIMKYPHSFHFFFQIEKVEPDTHFSYVFLLFVKNVAVGVTYSTLCATCIFEIESASRKTQLTQF